jgi:hypothetical protein
MRRFRAFTQFGELWHGVATGQILFTINTPILRRKDMALLPLLQSRRVESDEMTRDDGISYPAHRTSRKVKSWPLPAPLFFLDPHPFEVFDNVMSWFLLYDRTQGGGRIMISLESGTNNVQVDTVDS